MGIPTTPREELIAELEELGFDQHSAKAGFADRDWRALMSDDELRQAINLLGEEEPDWPDISEMVDAIKKATVSLTLIERPGDFDRDALATCRAILLRAELAGRTIA